jgi:hypothetical protein
MANLTISRISFTELPARMEVLRLTTWLVLIWEIGFEAGAYQMNVLALRTVNTWNHDNTPLYWEML